MPASIIYPHQLFATSPALNPDRRVYLVEEPLLFTHNPIHRQKLIFHKLSIDAYERMLCAAGHEVVRLTIHDHRTSERVFERVRNDGVTQLHIVDTADDYLERAITESGMERIWYDSPLFILPKQEAMERYRQSKRFMASFYKQMRKDKGVLLEANGEPRGGKWSYDEANRAKLPKDIALPDDITLVSNAETETAAAWAESVPAEQYGEAGCWLPYTPAGAEKFLTEFLCARFADFGTYEDAITTQHTRLFHSALSPLLNVGLLTPQRVLEAALAFGERGLVPLNSLEGFVRQILGWREFIRASYEVDGCLMRRQNFFGHTRPLPTTFWTGATGVAPVDHTIHTALRFGYTHHIERLMVMGNFMLLSQIDPTEVYRWFMGMYVDAYDWVMVPNVYGMSQFADGGSFATKPYISGANYLRKMSDYSKGDWEELWTALYWHFIDTHQEFFKANPRLAMMPRTWQKMDETKKAALVRQAKMFLRESP